MAYIPRKLYLITTPGGARKVKLPNYYDGINAQLGLSDAPAGTVAPKASTRELLKEGLAVKIRTRRKISDTKYVVTDVLCDIDQAMTALSALEGKSFGTGSTGGIGSIVSAYFPSRARFG